MMHKTAPVTTPPAKEGSKGCRKCCGGSCRTAAPTPPISSVEKAALDAEKKFK